MPILNIAPVTRSGLRLLISLYGLSETGKTLSALRLAAGIEPDPAKRMLLDTEGGQRGRAYVDHIDGGYLYANLSRPFTPERYSEAIAEIEARGVNLLVIDSVSHAWFGEGGILDMVEVANEKNDMAKWAKPKRRLAKMTGRLLSSDMHIILCSRAKQPLIEEYVDGRKKLVPGPVVPIQEKNLRFDMTIMAQMLGDGRFSVGKPEGKCPGMLREIFAAGQVMDEAMGRRLRDWAQAEGGKSPAQRRLTSDATDAAEAGTERLLAFWDALTREQKLTLKPDMDNLKSIAAAVDREVGEQGRRESGDRAGGAPLVVNGGDQSTARDPGSDDPDLTAFQIPLPRKGNGAPDFVTWRNEFIGRLNEAGDEADIERIVGANLDVFDEMEAVDAKGLAGLRDRIGEARKAVSVAVGK